MPTKPIRVAYGRSVTEGFLPEPDTVTQLSDVEFLRLEREWQELCLAAFDNAVARDDAAAAAALAQQATPNDPPPEAAACAAAVATPTSPLPREGEPNESDEAGAAGGRRDTGRVGPVPTFVVDTAEEPAPPAADPNIEGTAPPGPERPSSPSRFPVGSTVPLHDVMDRPFAGVFLTRDVMGPIVAAAQPQQGKEGKDAPKEAAKPPADTVAGLPINPDAIGLRELLGVVYPRLSRQDIDRHFLGYVPYEQLLALKGSLGTPPNHRFAPPRGDLRSFEALSRDTGGRLGLETLAANNYAIGHLSFSYEMFLSTVARYAAARPDKYKITFFDALRTLYPRVPAPLMLAYERVYLTPQLVAGLREIFILKNPQVHRVDPKRHDETARGRARSGMGDLLSEPSSPSNAFVMSTTMSTTGTAPAPSTPGANVERLAVHPSAQQTLSLWDYKEMCFERRRYFDLLPGVPLTHGTFTCIDGGASNRITMLAAARFLFPNVNTASAQVYLDRLDAYDAKRVASDKVSHLFQRYQQQNERLRSDPAFRADADTALIAETPASTPARRVSGAEISPGATADDSALGSPPARKPPQLQLQVQGAADDGRDGRDDRDELVPYPLPPARITRVAKGIYTLDEGNEWLDQVDEIMAGGGLPASRTPDDVAQETPQPPPRGRGGRGSARRNRGGRGAGPTGRGGATPPATAETPKRRGTERSAEADSARGRGRGAGPAPVVKRRTSEYAAKLDTIRGRLDEKRREAHMVRDEDDDEEGSRSSDGSEYASRAFKGTWNFTAQTRDHQAYGRYLNAQTARGPRSRANSSAQRRPTLTGRGPRRSFLAASGSPPRNGSPGAFSPLPPITNLAASLSASTPLDVSRNPRRPTEAPRGALSPDKSGRSPKLPTFSTDAASRRAAGFRLEASVRQETPAMHKAMSMRANVLDSRAQPLAVPRPKPPSNGLEQTTLLNRDSAKIYEQGPLRTRQRRPQRHHEHGRQTHFSDAPTDHSASVSCLPTPRTRSPQSGPQGRSPPATPAASPRGSPSFRRPPPVGRITGSAF